MGRPTAYLDFNVCSGKRSALTKVLLIAVCYVGKMRTMPMARLNIPTRFRPGFEKLRDLSDTAFDDLVRATLAAQPHVYAETFVDSLEAGAPEVPAPELREIMDAVIGASQARLSLREPTENFVASLIGSGEMDLGDNPQRLPQRLTRLLEIEPIRTTSKAMDLVVADENPYESASLVTDIRPLFADVIGPDIPAAVLMHLLKIGYVHDAERRSITIAMDDRDLAELKAIINRAEAKSDALRTLLDRWSVCHIESREIT